MAENVLPLDLTLESLKGLAIHDKPGGSRNPIRIVDFEEIGRSARRTPKKPKSFDFKILPKAENERLPLSPIRYQTPVSSPARLDLTFDTPVADEPSIRSTSTADSPTDLVIGPKRRVIYSDDESEGDDREEIVAKDAEEPKQSQIVTARTRRGRYQENTFLDVETMTDRKDDPSDVDGYDSPGSLRDFIVDDDEIEFESDASETDRKNAYREPIEISSDEHDSATPICWRDVETDPSIDLASSEEDQKESAKAPSKATTKRQWNQIKHRLAANLVKELDENVFGSELHDVQIEWSSRLLRTAGRAHKSRARPGETRPVVRIELAEKVLDDEARLNSTLAHEMCHIATWLISKDMKNPHGKNFKMWGSKVNRYRPDIVVTTKHNYMISYKYEWQCTKEECGVIFGRHSKSIDIATQRCGKCKSRLMPMFAERQASQFQLYMKENMRKVMEDLPGASRADVMKEIGQRWAREKEAGKTIIEVSD